MYNQPTETIYGDLMSEQETYKSFGRISRVKIERNGSKFIGIGAAPVSLNELQKTRRGIEEEFNDSTHVCSGSVLLEEGRGVERYQNDGEPAGTAGKPILQVLTGEGLKNCAIFVVRYFGGTELGTGGLVRAYSDSARAVVDKSEIVVKKPRSRLEISFDYDLTGKVTGVLGRFNEVEVLNRDYGEKLNLELSVFIDVREKLLGSLIESTSGGVEVNNLEDT